MATYLPQQRKLATANQIRGMNKTAFEQGRNRYLPPEVLSDLDPDLLNICYEAMTHETADGNPVSLHVRTFWFLALKGCDPADPPRGAIDVDADVYMALPNGN